MNQQDPDTLNPRKSLNPPKLNMIYQRRNQKLSATTALSLFLASATYTPQALAQGAVQTALGEVQTFADLISLIWSFGSKVLIGLAVFFIVLGAFFYMASGGNEERVEEGKQMIFGSLVAIVIVLLSGVFMRLFHQPAQGTSGNLSEIPKVVGNATNILIGLIGGFAVLMLIYSAFIYLTAQGNRTQIQQAHKALRYAIYGLVLGSVAYAVVSVVVRFLV